MITRPRPSATPPGPSPTIAPTMLAVAAILRAVNRYGSDAGSRNFTYACHGDAAYDRISSMARGSNERRPRIIAIVTGKKVRYVAMMTTLMTLWPKANTIIGARAMIGMVWLAMTYGTKARSKRREWTNAVASARPTNAPTTKPIPASRHV